MPCSDLATLPPLTGSESVHRAWGVVVHRSKQFFNGQMLDVDTTNRELVAKATNPADDASWAQLHGAYHLPLVRHCLRSGLTAIEAEEIAQEVLVTLSHRLSKAPFNWKATSLRAWLSQTANRLVFEVHRTKRRDRVSAEAMKCIQKWLPPALAPEAESQAREQLEAHLWSVCLARVRTAVPAVRWQIFESYALHGKSSRAVACLFNTTEFNVRIIRFRMVNLIRQEWKQLADQQIDLPT